MKRIIAIVVIGVLGLAGLGLIAAQDEGSVTRYNVQGTPVQTYAPGEPIRACWGESGDVECPEAGP